LRSPVHVVPPLDKSEKQRRKIDQLQRRKELGRNYDAALGKILRKFVNVLKKQAKSLNIFFPFKRQSKIYIKTICACTKVLIIRWMPSEKYPSHDPFSFTMYSLRNLFSMNL
jgi:hypothetical protein